MRLSILLPTKGQRPEMLQRCLDSIDRNTNNYELILLDYEGGYNAKLNDGIRRAKGDWLAYLHDDCEVEPGWSEVLAEVSSPWVGDHGGTVWNCGYKHWHQLDTGEDFIALVTNVDDTPDFSGMPIIKREAQEKIGFWDENFKEPWYQDNDWGMQIRQSGYIFTPVPGRIIHHFVGNSQNYDRGNRHYFMHKWGWTHD